MLLCTLRQIATAQADNDSVTIDIMTFNILHGATTKGDFNLDHIAQVIKDADPDLVALQEVDYQTNRAKGYDLVTELGWRTKMSPLFGRAMYYDGGEYGEGILSKASILSSRNVALPHSPGSEPRAALEITTVLSSGDTICFVGTHFDHLQNERDRLAQARAVNAAFISNRHPTILAGDLNAEPDSKTIALIEEHWTHSYEGLQAEPTYPSHDPKKKIDYIYSYPDRSWQVISTKVIADAVASDHCAYLVRLKLLR